MKNLLFFLVLTASVWSCRNESRHAVLVFIKDGSEDTGYMLKNEIVPIRKILEQNGFRAAFANLTGAIVKSDSFELKPDVRLSDARAADYEGFVLPCMASSAIPKEAVDIVNEFTKMNKPVAAQLGSVLILGEAGVLKGKKYTYEFDNDPDTLLSKAKLAGAVYSGKGVVRDGNIITSGICPMMAKMYGFKDGTSDLMNEFIKALREK